MLHLVSGISFLCLFVNLILAPVPPTHAHLFLHPSLSLLIHHFVHLYLHISFTPGLKPTSFTNPTPLSFSPSSRTASTDFCLHRFFWATRFLILIFSLFFVSGPCARLSWPSRQLLSARKSTVSYRIVRGNMQDTGTGLKVVIWLAR